MKNKRNLVKIVDTWLDRVQKTLQPGILVFEFSIKFAEKN